MKKCPQCNRTYADEGFTFCLEDGALLSAPYNPNKEEPLSTIQSSGPPPTLVLPPPDEEETRSGGAAYDRAASPLPPTIASPSLDAGAREPRLSVRPQPVVGTPNRRRYYLLIPLLVGIIVFAAIALYAYANSDCPKLLIHCSPESAILTYCDLSTADSVSSSGNSRPISEAICSRSVVLFQAPALPTSITNIKWSASAGTTNSKGSQMVLDTRGLSGQTITVKAGISSSRWFCSNTVSTSFVVPTATPSDEQKVP